MEVALVSSEQGLPVQASFQSCPPLGPFFIATENEPRNNHFIVAELSIGSRFIVLRYYHLDVCHQQ